MKKKQKFLITDNQQEVQNYLDMGWFIVSVTPQYIPQAVDGFSTHVKFAVVLERGIEND
jgi:hypothetical protein